MTLVCRGPDGEYFDPEITFPVLEKGNYQFMVNDVMGWYWNNFGDVVFHLDYLPDKTKFPE